MEVEQPLKGAPPAAPLGAAAKTAIALSSVPISIAMTAITPVLPRIEAALAHGATDQMLTKQLVAGVGVTMVFGAPLAGFLTDRFGVRKVFAASALIFGLAGSVGLFTNSLLVLLISRLVVGATIAAPAAIGMTLVNTRMEGSANAKWMGIVTAGALISTLALHPLAGALGQLGWRAPFTLYLFGLPYAGLALFSFDDRRLERKTSKTAPRRLSLSWFPVSYGVLAVLVGYVTLLPVVYAPFVLRQAGVSSPLVFSLVSLGSAIVASITALTYGRARARFSATGIFIFCFACLALGATIVSVLPTLPGVTIGSLISGLAIGWTVPNLMSSAAPLVPPDRQGLTVGILKGAIYLAPATGVITIEPLAHLYGSSVAYVITAALSLIGLTFFLRQLIARPALTRVGAS